jgi:triacylglycerol lipase
MLAVGLVPTAASLSAQATAGADGPVPVVVQATEAVQKQELVVLVHGMGRTRLSMLLLERALEREGYQVMNWGYSSYSQSVSGLGRRLRTDLEARGGSPPERVHFVAHSLGNVIVRWVLANDPPRTTGRVVMLAPPNGGSRTADRYARWLGWLLRPLPELRTDSTGITRTLDLPPGVEVGVIAGRYDGKVSVAETHLAGERAHRVVPSAHTFIMNRKDVRRLTLGFLREGRFEEE